MSLADDSYFEEDGLVFVPLGGAGEIGMNLSLYGYGGRWIVVDFGVSFGDDSTPGVEVMVPDISFAEEIRDRIEGIVITHAHEDHLGAVPYLWKRLRRPVYASPFASALLRRKIMESEAPLDIPLNPVGPGKTLKLGPFEIEYIAAAHSIPEAHILAIRTPAGTIAHATDWKLDPHPLIGPVTDEAALERLGREGVRALVCDSTNVFVPGRAGSEAPLRDSLIEIVGRCSGRVAIAGFASNVARLDTVARAAEATGRHAVMVGRSLHRVLEAARECGYLTDLPPFLPEEEAGFLPPERVLYAVTGSQGEPRSALARIAMGEHAHAVLEPHDTVIFSSRMIPGNERAILRIQNQLARKGVQVITEEDAFVHVSGHPCRDELVRLYQWLHPEVLVPIHGEVRHLMEQAKLAAECQIAHTIVAENGAAVRLDGPSPGIVGSVPAGRGAIDGHRIVPVDGDVLRSRRRMGLGGTAVATVVLDDAGRLLADPQLTIQGLIELDTSEEVHEAAIDAIVETIEGLPPRERGDDAEVSEAARIAIRRSLRATIGKRPMTEVHVVRLPGRRKGKGRAT